VNVQADELVAIRRAWVDRGSPKCEHRRTAREYMFGMHTGDLACLDCGATWWDDGKASKTGGTAGADKPR